MSTSYDDHDAHPLGDRLADPAPLDLSRRAASMLLLAGAAGAVLSPTVAWAQVKPAGGTANPASAPAGTSPATSASPVPSFLDNVIKVRQGKTKDRTLKVSLRVTGFAEDTNRRNPKDSKPLVITTLDFQTAAIVFPVLHGTATSVTDTENVKGEARYDQKIIDATPDFNDTYPCGTRLGKWTMLKQAGGRNVDLNIDIPMTCNSVIFDERAASQATWPAKWGKIAQSTFTNQMFVEYKDKVVTDLLNTWTEGKDPKIIPPVQLAKFLAQKCIEYFQFSGNGEEYNQNGELEGLIVNGARSAIVAKKCPQHDIACAVCALYRAAGLPARIVIGYDINESKGDDKPALSKSRGRGDLRSWVEFCLYDEKADKELWVPVDVVRQRKKSSRPPELTKPWDYFGNYDDGEFVLPFAFQFHPPTSVIQYGALAFWGWMTTPQIASASQTLRFQTIVTPKRSNKPSQGRPKGG